MTGARDRSRPPWKPCAAVPAASCRNRGTTPCWWKSSRAIADGQAARRRDARFSRDYEEARQIQRALPPRPCPACAMPDCRAMDTCCEHRRRLLRCVAIQRYARGVVDCRCRGQRAAAAATPPRTCKPRSAFSPLPQANEVCSSVNRLLCRNIASGKFVTFCYAVIDLERGRV